MDRPQELELLQPLPRGRGNAVLEADGRPVPASVAFPFDFRRRFRRRCRRRRQVFCDADQRLSVTPRRSVVVVTLVFVVTI